MHTVLTTLKRTFLREKVNDNKDWLKVLGEALFKECLQWLDVTSLIECCRVNKAWSAVASSNSVWIPRFRRDFPKQPPKNDSVKARYGNAEQERRANELRMEWEARLQALHTERRVCRMFHPTNGRFNFEPCTPSVPFNEMPDRETLVNILIRDNELRLSKDVQEQYWISDYPSGVTLAVQTKAVSEYGFSDPWIIPSAISYFKDDAEIMNIPHYVKFNRSRQGNLNCGDSIPDIPLTNTHGCATSLRQQLEPFGASPVVLVAGSYT